MRHLIAILLLVTTLGLAGCKTNAAGDQSISLDPIIGLIGMAVDGDDKDDYEHFLSDKCDCDGKCHCH